MMNSYSELVNVKKLKNKGIVLEELFSPDINNKKKILSRRSDEQYNQEIHGCYKIAKRYIKDNKVIKSLDIDDGILYSYNGLKKSDLEITCNNCGYTSKKEDFVNGCPFCKTSFNIHYNNKKKGIKIKKYSFDSKILKRISLVISAIFVILSFFGEEPGMTREEYVSVYFMLAPVAFIGLYFLLLFLFSAISLPLLPFAALKYLDNKRAMELWDSLKEKQNGFNANKFYNDLYLSLSSYYYNDPKNSDMIDFDILSYNDVSYEDNNSITIYLSVRKVFYKNKIIIRKNKVKIVMDKNGYYIPPKQDYKVIKCDNCGASINEVSGECKYCHTKYNTYNQWINSSIKEY